MHRPAFEVIISYVGKDKLSSDHSLQGTFPKISTKSIPQ